MRTFTSVLPVSRERRGQCHGCGACCKLPYVCPFLIVQATVLLLVTYVPGLSTIFK